MKNYAEQLAYLYFRLNGFFLIDNYVSHASETDNRYHADNDLLGVRPPHVFEIVGQKDAGDSRHLHQLMNSPEGDSGFDLRKTIGIICESKGGTASFGPLKNDKLESCINRLGLLTDSEKENAIDTLGNASIFSNDRVFIAKVLVLRESQNSNEDYIHLTTQQIISFIRDRVENYPEKQRAWNHYGSDILQLILTEHIGDEATN